MAEFFNVISPSDAVSLMTSELKPVGKEIIDTSNALGRVSFSEIKTNEDLPAYDRSAMDGCSVRAMDTYGASESLPAYLELAGEVPMGRSPRVKLQNGEVAVAFTGGMLAKGADAVVMVENTNLTQSGLVEVFRPVAQGENVIMRGEDYSKGDVILREQSTIGAAHMGSILAVGITQMEVYQTPKIGVISAGDELVDPDSSPCEGQIRDVNLYTIGSLVKSMGAYTKYYPRLPDDFVKQKTTAEQALLENDMLIFTSGSSVSHRDMTANVIKGLGNPGILAHGLALKPGKPTIMGMVNDKIVVGLPGNPVSAITVFDNVLRPVIAHLKGLRGWNRRIIGEAILSTDIQSSSGRTDLIRVKIRKDIDSGRMYADPVLGKSNTISVLSSSDGYFEISSPDSGVYAGTTVKVFI